MTRQQTEEPRSFTFESVSLKPEEQIGLHQHSVWEVSYIITGAGLRLIGDTTEPFSSGEITLVPPDTPHCWCFDGNTTDARGHIQNITVTFSDELLDNCAGTFPELSAAIDRLKSLRESAVSFSGGKAGEMKRLLLDMRKLDKATQTAFLLRLLLLISDPEDVSVISRRHAISREEERVNQAKTYIACNACRDIALQDVASHMGMNRSSFCVFFKKAMGETFVSYLNRLRIENVCRLITSEKCSVAEACYKSGFNDVHYFNRLFKRLKGVPPTVWLAKQ